MSDDLVDLLVIDWLIACWSPQLGAEGGSPSDRSSSTLRTDLRLSWRVTHTLTLARPSVIGISHFPGYRKTVLMRHSAYPALLTICSRRCDKRLTRDYAEHESVSANRIARTLSASLVKAALDEYRLSPIQFDC